MEFPFHEDHPNVKEMTEEAVQNRKTAYLKANTDHGYSLYFIRTSKIGS